MKLTVNTVVHEVDADADTPLLWVIRDNLGMTGTKYGCGIAQCGACSVMIDGKIARSCVTTVGSVGTRAVTTIEAIEGDPVGRRVVDTWVKHQVPQCGYCQSGQVMAATALLKQNARPSAQEVAAAMVNLCRCGTYNAIGDAVDDLAGIAPVTTATAVAGGGTAMIAAAVLAGVGIAVATSTGDEV